VDLSHEFDAELESFLRGSDHCNVFLGGAVHARLLNRWWSARDGIVCLLRPIHFQHLIGEGWPPSNRLVSGESDGGYRELIGRLAWLYLGLGHVLARSATAVMQQDLHRKLIRHCVSLLSGADRHTRVSHWNFVTHEDDVKGLIAEDDEFDNKRRQHA
jgi:hypothetical protein